MLAREPVHAEDHDTLGLVVEEVCALLALEDIAVTTEIVFVYSELS